MRSTFTNRIINLVLLSVVTTLLMTSRLQAQVSGVAPQMFFRETDQALPNGLWRVQFNNNQFNLQMNTDASGAFGTTTTYMSGTGGAITFPAGPIRLTDGSIAAPPMSFSGATGTGFSRNTSFGYISVDIAGTEAVALQSTGIGLATGGAVSWNGDTFVVRDTSNVVAQKNATTAQEFRIYGTTTGPKYTALGNNGIGYMVTNDASALQFGVQNSPIWELEGTAGFLRPVGDNTKDIGGSSNRIRTGHLGTSLNIGISTNTGGQLYVGGNAQQTMYLDTAVGSSSSSLFIFRKSRGTQANRGTGTNGDVVNGDLIGGIGNNVFSGTTEFSTAAINFLVDGTYTSGQRPPSRMEFYTNAPNGAQTLQNVISGVGVFGFGGLANTNPALKKSGTELQVRLGNDSDFTGLSAKYLSIGTTDVGGSVNLANGSQFRFRKADNSGDQPSFQFGNLDNVIYVTPAMSLTGPLDVATGKFVVNTSGNITKINNVTTSFPSAQGAANQLLANDGAGNLSWVDSSGGMDSRVSTQFDKTSSTSPSNITGLSATVVTGRTYEFEAILYTTSNVAGGVKFTISDGGFVIASNIIYEAVVYSAAGVIAQTRATSLNTEVGAVTAVTVALVRITGTISVSNGGPLRVGFAQNTSNGSASSILVGSTFAVRDIT